MSLLAGFCELDITPTRYPVRTYFGSADTPLDRLYAHAAVFRQGDAQIALLSLDVVIVEREYVEAIRNLVGLRHPECAVNLMVCATHNHACPAVVDRPGSERDEAYLRFMVERGAAAVISAHEALQPAETGCGSGYENRISFNRRFVRRNGTVISEPDIDMLSADLLYNEGIIDPMVGVLALDVVSLVSNLTYSSAVTVTARSDSLALRYRDIAGLEANIDHLERFNVMEKLVRKGWYRHSLDRLRALHAAADHEDAEIQVFRIGDLFIGSVPAEYFAQNALRIKELSPVSATWVATLANGWLGYIPHRAAFQRIGGHETTWALWSKMVPEAGDQLANRIIGLIKELCT